MSRRAGDCLGERGAAATVETERKAVWILTFVRMTMEIVAMMTAQTPSS